MRHLTRNTIAAGILFCSIASADTKAIHNVFFGFDFVLYPIAVKWACGGPREQDLAVLGKLIAAFPEDAEAAELQGHVDTMAQVTEESAALITLFGDDLSADQQDRLCTAALPLSIDWATPEGLIDENVLETPAEQKAAWQAFFEVAESLN